MLGAGVVVVALKLISVRPTLRFTMGSGRRILLPRPLRYQLISLSIFAISPTEPDISHGLVRSGSRIPKTPGSSSSFSGFAFSRIFNSRDIDSETETPAARFLVKYGRPSVISTIAAKGFTHPKTAATKSNRRPKVPREQYGLNQKQTPIMTTTHETKDPRNDQSAKKTRTHNGDRWKHITRSRT